MTNSWPANYASAWNGQTHNWMSQIDEQVLLKDLSIPGTHDSCSRLGYCHPISTTQYATIEEQLEAGIRFLDIRIKTDGASGLRIVHGSEDIGDYYDNKGRLSFETVLENIYKWMNMPKHQNECVIIKVVDCDHTALNTEGKDYDTDKRVYNIWKSVDDKSSIKRLEFNKQCSTEGFLQMTVGQAKGKLLLWRVFKYPETIIAGARQEFGLNLYQLKDESQFDNNDYYDIVSPSSDFTKGALHTLHAQSLYTWKFSGAHKTLSYAGKMNVVLRLLYDAWCGHANGVWTQKMNYFCLNELNIAAIYQSSGNRQDVDASRYYPITNASCINPLVGQLLDQLLAAKPSLPTLTDKSAKSPGSVGIMLFDWADSPDSATRDFKKTRDYNEPLYKKVIQFNFQRSKIFNLTGNVYSIRYKKTSNDPYAVLQYKKNSSWLNF